MNPIAAGGARLGPNYVGLETVGERGDKFPNLPIYQPTSV